ncbi:hypothetical protein KVP06_08760 [Geobacter sulfurreducens]|jgi:hypothetical protein|uniref:Uncharacterized protein n=1 Tax=Geobacter sulfurreducens (strain ATCC 51573 / DSM 12127 / PCA) TaxID=243231 RepID=Q74CC5_GEOSL|nr:hypothetical protein [Geobacter sulfurreducens]AAR35126.2 hypothetical protein GSU1749 [Geobacter sulfurreducens PCA]ADI84586.2 hypothetical protein KN400_1774 [Geobacter sulfurreducens KN400]UAC02498.1 hypothetical protein KVP06_08760 [Geobacter sulfurreducens]UTG91216.1 hypothetical protein J8622_09160 [Geobacter sulfurreducens]
MATILREVPLQNGLTVRFLDHTRHYFGDFHLVRLEILCEIRLDVSHFQDFTAFEDARRLLGDDVSYRRFVEQMGVPTSLADDVKQQLMAHFMNHSLGYVSSSAFPIRFVQSELERARSKRLKAPGFLVSGHD